ncbi:MAG TPA: hypothetical protein DIS96_13010 [Pusillimonas sp.]|nr:hypothetical protein [Pusillimonas sp.]|tara:strand:+ start:167 stop:364 length:198 start_codon:yes stop_codon:yes gene_type:complete
MGVEYSFRSVNLLDYDWQAYFQSDARYSRNDGDYLLRQWISNVVPKPSERAVGIDAKRFLLCASI